MNEQQVRTEVIKALTSVAPDAASLDPKANLRDELDLDSIDFLNFVVALHKALGISVPEADYRRMSTIDACVTYLAPRVSAQSS